jgi:hypothetical protein
MDMDSFDAFLADFELSNPASLNLSGLSQVADWR